MHGLFVGKVLFVHVDEFRAFADEAKLHPAKRAVAVLGKNEFRRTLDDGLFGKFFRRRRDIGSASCSIAPDSRRSESCGSLVWIRRSCDSAMTGTSSSFAMILRSRVMEAISC